MRVRITRRPPASYETTADSLKIGRTYDLPSELAAALVVEGCAEFADDSDFDETRHFHGGGFTESQANERAKISRDSKSSEA